jgi:hypothetical protein
MNARLDPRIVAARIEGAAAGEHGAAAAEDRITPSSHGCKIEVFHFTAHLGALPSALPT